MGEKKVRYWHKGGFVQDLMSFDANIYYSQTSMQISCLVRKLQDLWYARKDWDHGMMGSGRVWVADENYFGNVLWRSQCCANGDTGGENERSRHNDDNLYFGDDQPARKKVRVDWVDSLHFEGGQGVNYAASKKITVEKYDAVDFLENEFLLLIVVHVL